MTRRQVWADRVKWNAIALGLGMVNALLMLACYELSPKGTW